MYGSSGSAPGSAPGQPSSAAAMSYMNGAAYSAMSMYGSNSPYGSQGQSMSPAAPGGGPDGQQPQGGQNSPGGSVKSESGNGGGSGVSMPSESPSDNGYPSVIKRECTPPTGGPPTPGATGPPPPPGPPSGPPPQGGAQPQDLNRMISMYLPGDAAAAAAGDPNAQSRIQSMYAGHYQAMMGQAGAAEHLAMAGHAHHAMSMAHM